MKSVKIIKSIAHDGQSRIRGIGRYAQALQSAFPEQDSTISDIASDIVIHPFVNLIAPPYLSSDLITHRRTIGVIHDVIPLKHTQFPWVGIKGTLWKTINLKLLKFYRAFVTDSQTSKQDLIDICQLSPDIIHVVYPYSGLQDVSVEHTENILPYGLTPHKYVLYVGDVNWHKNIAQMARAAIEANITLVCVGGAFTKSSDGHPWSSELQKFHELAEANPARILCTGFVDDRVLATLFTYALANMLISLDEGFGYAYIEAGHFGTPSILTDAPIFHEISADKGALFVDSSSTTSIAQAIQMLQSDHSKRETLGAQAKAKSATYSRKRFVDGWQDVLATL